jgi:hypothetical protein
MITATVNADAVKKKLAYIIEDMPTAVAIGVNSTSKKARKDSTKKLKEAMNVTLPPKVFKSAIRAREVASKSHLRAIVALERGLPISLRYFQPKQTKRDGTSVRMNNNIKGKAGRKSLPTAFVVKRLGNKVFERKTRGKGSKRLPIIEQFGPNAGELMQSAGIKEFAIALIRKEAPKRIQRRIRFLLLRQSGGLRGNQPSRNQ